MNQGRSVLLVFSFLAASTFVVLGFQNCTKTTEFAIDPNSQGAFAVDFAPPIIGGNSDIRITINEYPTNAQIDDSDAVLDFAVSAPGSTLDNVECFINQIKIDCGSVPGGSSDPGNSGGSNGPGGSNDPGNSGSQDPGSGGQGSGGSGSQDPGGNGSIEEFRLPISGEDLGLGTHTFTIRGENAGGDTAEETIEWTIFSRIVPKNKDIIVNEINDRVDILIVVDSSGSMKQEQQNLAERVSTFMSRFKDLDYRIAVITTNWQVENDTSHGRAAQYPDGSYCISPDLDIDTAQQYLGETIEAVGANDGQGRERGIYTSRLFYERAAQAGTNESECVRQGASKHIIVISDEDESIYEETGAQKEKTDSPLPDFDKSKGETLKTYIADEFPDSTMKFHAIIASPFSDEGVECLNNGTAFRFGRRYATFSNSTGGEVGNICADDYGDQLQKMGDSVSDSQKVYGLGCIAIANGTDAGRVTQNGQPVTFGWSFAADKIEFAEKLPRGTYRVQYYCYE